MTAITKTYANAKSTGQERVTRSGDGYTINSYIPQVGWMGERQVTRAEVTACLQYTSAPAHVVSAILGE
jgi:hypothetical protein